MELQNEMYKAREAGAAGSPEWSEEQDIYLRMVAPVAPHIAEELWTVHLGRPYSIHQQSWPQVAEAGAKEDSIEIPVQVNGKVRDRVVVPADADEEQIKSAALASDQVQKYLEGRQPRKVIVANRRLVNVVVFPRRADVGTVRQLQLDVPRAGQLALHGEQANADAHRHRSPGPRHEASSSPSPTGRIVAVKLSSASTRAQKPRRAAVSRSPGSERRAPETR